MYNKTFKLPRKKKVAIDRLYCAQDGFVHRHVETGRAPSLRIAATFL
jgi:hypothetical protein